MGQCLLHSLGALASPLVLAHTAQGEALSSTAPPVPALSFGTLLDCQHSPPYRRFFDLVSAKGWQDRDVFNFAYDMWNKLDFPDVPGGRGSAHDEFAEDFAWHSTLKVSPGMDLWMLRQVMLLAKAFGVQSHGKLSFSEYIAKTGGSADLVPTDCPFGFIGLAFALLVGSQLLGQHMIREEMSDAVVAVMEVLLHAPYHTYDFLESSAWNLSTYDIAVNLDSAYHYASFAEYEANHPVPPPLLPPWHAVEQDTAPLPRSDALQAALRALERRTASRQAITIAMLQFHDGTAAELWASTQAALKSLVGLQSSWLQSFDDALQLRLFFTQVKALRGTETGDWLASRTAASWESWQRMKRAAQQGQVSMDDVRNDWLPRETPALIDADLVICSEPFWLCPLLASRRSRAMVGALHMSMLNECPFADEENIAQFWFYFKAMMDDRKAFMSVSCRITGEQVRHQSGWRVPYVPFIGLGVQARYAPGQLRQALLFRNNRQNMLAFRVALRMFTEEVMPDCPAKVVDMNEVQRALSFQEIAEFHAVVLLPHGPNALRLSDLYAAAIPMVVPEEPLVHKFVWGSRTFGGYDAENHYLQPAPEALRHRGNSEPPPFHPTNYLQAWSIHRYIDDRRYWHQYTEWATLPHLQHFWSLPSLLHVLAALTREEGIRVSIAMAKHHAVLVSEVLSWWRLALADLIVAWP